MKASPMAPACPAPPDRTNVPAQRAEHLPAKGRDFDSVLLRSRSAKEGQSNDTEHRGETPSKVRLEDALHMAPSTQAPLVVVSTDSVRLPASLPACADPIVPQEIHRPVLACVRNDLPQLQVRLHPPELGPMKMSVSLEDRVLRVLFEASNAQAMDALQNSLPALREALAQRGLTLATCSIRLLSKSRQASRSHKENSP